MCGGKRVRAQPLEGDGPWFCTHSVCLLAVWPWASDKGQASVSSFGKGPRPTSQADLPHSVRYPASKAPCTLCSVDGTSQNDVSGSLACSRGHYCAIVSLRELKGSAELCSSLGSWNVGPLTSSPWEL